MTKQIEKQRKETLQVVTRIHDLFWSDDGPVPEGKLSTDAIKHIFDAIRNYLIIAAVFLGALALRDHSFEVPNSAEGSFGSIVFYVLATISVCLSVLNAFFILNLFHTTEFLKTRRYPFYWSVVVALLATVLGILVMLSSVVAKH